jgi:hypothetical protein
MSNMPNWLVPEDDRAIPTGVNITVNKNVSCLYPGHY